MSVSHFSFFAACPSGVKAVRLQNVNVVGVVLQPHLLRDRKTQLAIVSEHVSAWS
jgi:hypothetical protein